MAKIFKASAEQLHGLAFEELFMPEDRDIFVPNILKLTRENNEFETEAMLRCLDDTSFLGLISTSYFQWEDERCMAITVHDISKMKAIERMLKHSERVAFLGHMLDDISHQIRNPVIVMGGLARRLAKVASNKKYADAIVQESNRLELLLDTLNDFILLAKPKEKYITLQELVTTVEPLFQSIAEKHDVQWQCTYDVTLLPEKILIDLQLLLIAVEAIILNACEAYAGKNGTKIVTMQITKTDNNKLPYSIKISDHGLGIAADDLPHVSSHFFSKKTRHIGMGLTFAQRIMEEQGGNLLIDSTEGQGTTITLFLKQDRRRTLRTEKFF